MSYMFYKCSSLEYLNISNFKIKSSVNTTKMFYGCDLLQNRNDYEKKFYKEHNKCICF